MPAELPRSIAIVGLGLMGGSLALALGNQPVVVTGVDHDPAICAAAEAGGVVAAATTDLALGLAAAELIVLATPVRSILDLIATLPTVRQGGAALLDLGSTKAAIVAAMDQLPSAFQAVGGHPMCGREQGGLANATPELYRGGVFVRCRSSRTTPQVVAQTTALIEAIGAQSLWLTAGRHDRLVGLTSHLPYLQAALLLGLAGEAAQGDDALWSVAASGFRDTGRLAGSDPQMMLDILLTNRAAVLGHMRALRASSDALFTLLEQGDADGLHAWLVERNRAYSHYREAWRGAPPSGKE